ncbi:MAG: exodeoxyribonuclease III [Candidatus Eremiobacteraeota bacterium]|nr:exodeoxyribonuclease III [Candidatus Eremiobacteraeota bacterium]
MRVITLNVNGIRSAQRRGFFQWMQAQDADVVCMQETRAQEHQLPLDAGLPGYTAVFVDARRRGYSGVALYSRVEPRAIRRTLGWDDVDSEGRFVQADLGAISVSSLYVPSGITGPARQAFKMSFLERRLAVLAQLRHSHGHHIVCGDFNIAHKSMDTYSPARNRHVSGSLPEERAWMDALVDRVGWVDAFRLVNREPKQYTWWSNWPAAWERNLGWRLDYQMITPALAAGVRSASIYKGARFSDHAPLTVDYEIQALQDAGRESAEHRRSRE